MLDLFTRLFCTVAFWNEHYDQVWLVPGTLLDSDGWDPSDPLQWHP